MQTCRQPNWNTMLFEPHRRHDNWLGNNRFPHFNFNRKTQSIREPLFPLSPLTGVVYCCYYCCRKHAYSTSQYNHSIDPVAAVRCGSCVVIDSTPAMPGTHTIRPTRYDDDDDGETWKLKNFYCCLPKWARTPLTAGWRLVGQATRCTLSSSWSAVLLVGSTSASCETPATVPES